MRSVFIHNVTHLNDAEKADFAKKNVHLRHLRGRGDEAFKRGLISAGPRARGGRGEAGIAGIAFSDPAQKAARRTESSIATSRRRARCSESSMFGLALTVGWRRPVALRRARGAPRAFVRGHRGTPLSLWKTPEGTDPRGVDNYQKDRADVRGGGRRCCSILDFGQHPEALGRARRRPSARGSSGLDGLCDGCRRPRSSTRWWVSGAKVVEELGELAAFTRDLGALEAGDAREAHAVRTSWPTRSRECCRRHCTTHWWKYEAGWRLSPLLGWYGQQLSNSVAPVGPEAEALVVEHCQH